MRVVICGYYGFNNIGDEAILKSIITSLKKFNPNIEIVVLSNNVNHTKLTYNVDAINRWNFVAIFKELLKSDGLISGGGSLLQDVTSSRSIFYYTSIINLTKIAKKPVFIYAQGIGPIIQEKNKKIVSKCLNKVDYITLRDKDSINLVKSIGVKKNIDLVVDPVMGLSNYEKNYSKCRNYVSVSVRKWDKANVDYLKKIANACDKIVSSGTNIVFVPMHGIEDYEISKQVSDMMNKKSNIFNYEASIEEKINCIKNSKLMIGMRLHALIFAAISNTPMIGISYDPKIDSFLEIVNQPLIGSVYKEWDFNDLYKTSMNIIDNLGENIEILKNNCKTLKENALNTSKLAIELFEKE